MKVTIFRYACHTTSDGNIHAMRFMPVIHTIGLYGISTFTFHLEDIF